MVVGGSQAPLDPAPEQLVRLASAAVPNSTHTCLTLVDVHEQVHPLACSDDAADALHSVQPVLHDGAADDLLSEAGVVSIPDLSAGDRWPEFARLADQAGIRAVLAVRVPVDGVGQAWLSLYADEVGAFSEDDVELASICGAVLGAALRAQRDGERTTNLQIALATNRQIGTAMGVLMARNLLTVDQAFEQLREASQRLHRKLRDVADEVVRTGQLPTTG